MAKRQMEINAPILRRILAFVIDLFLVDIIIISPFSSLMLNFLPKQDSFKEMIGFTPDFTGDFVCMIIFIIAMSILYFTITEYKLGQTLGKMIVNIHVKHDDTKKQLGFFQCILRSLFLIPVFPFILLWILDPLFMLFSKNGKRLSEILSKTKTIMVVGY